MRNFFSSFKYLVKEFGFNPKNFFYSLKGIKPFLQNYSEIKKQIKKSSNNFPVENLIPALSDRFENAGSLPLHYFYLDLLVANKIYKNNPEKHVDVGSRIDGFVAHVASFREFEIFDIREFDKKIPNVKFVKADLMSNNFSVTDYCDSLSCLHALEHFGLGRYGDPVDIEGHIKGFKNLSKMLKKNGRFYFAVPIGRQRIEFNVHRVFSISYLLDFIQPDFDIYSFSFIDDYNNLHTDVSLDKSNIENNYGCNYGCGIFELIKKEISG